MPDGRHVRRPRQIHEMGPSLSAADGSSVDGADTAGMPGTELDAADLAADLQAAIQAAGYHPEAVTEGVEAALVSERVVDFFVHHEPTFDHDEVRRHVTVVALTPSRLILAHTDEHPPDDLLPSPYTSTTTETVALSAVKSVVVQRMVVQPVEGSSAPAGGQPSEAVLTVAWGAIRRIDTEPAQCPDPECEADHGYTGTLTADDFSLRVSAAADGADAVARVLRFARRLSAASLRP